MTYTQLTVIDRTRIAMLNQQGKNSREIAMQVEKHRSTVSRELMRNRSECLYFAETAQKLSEHRKSESASWERVSTEIVGWIIEKLELQWSPQQISNRMEIELSRTVSHEYIYQMVYADKKAGGHLYENLRCGGKQRKRRVGSRDRRGQIPDRVSIEKRPEVANERGRLGDLEGDLMIGAQQQGALHTLVDRKSRFVAIEKLLNKMAKGTIRAARRSILRCFHIHHSVTYDNGKEFTFHKWLKEKTGVDVYFAHAYSSYERGTNENTNGLIRQYFPKGLDFTTITQKQIDIVEERLNHRPRRVLGYKTPHEVHMDTEIRYFRAA